MVRCTITLLSMIVVTSNSMLHFPGTCFIRSKVTKLIFGTNPTKK